MKKPNRYLRELERRVSALETALAVATKGSKTRPEEPQEEDLSLLDRLRSYKGKPYEHGESSGVLTYAGAVKVGGRSFLWMREHRLPQILDFDDEVIARVLMALGNVSRVAIVKELAQRSRTTQELQALVGIQSTGQLYHHLKELLAAGIITQPRRSIYELSSSKLIPLLNVLATVSDLFPGIPDSESTGKAKKK